MLGVFVGTGNQVLTAEIKISPRVKGYFWILIQTIYINSRPVSRKVRKIQNTR